MAYLQVCTRTCSTFLISHHTNPARFLLDSNFFLIQLLQKKKKSKRITLYEKNSLQSYTVQCRTKTELETMNQIPKSPLRMSSLGVVHCTRVVDNGMANDGVGLLPLGPIMVD